MAELQNPGGRADSSRILAVKEITLRGSLNEREKEDGWK